jgi:hypothetical protein
MPVEKFPGDAAPEAELAGNIAVLPSRRERLAIVSTRNKLCGIAAYTQALERQLADIFDIRVFDLDQYLLRSQHPRVRPLATGISRRFAAKSPISTRSICSSNMARSVVPRSISSAASRGSSMPHHASR